MIFQDKREEHLKPVSLDTSRINLETPTLFLCGGLVDVKQPDPVSVRGAFVEYLHRVGCDLVDSITLAEDFKDWIHDSIYRDLLVFESDIAHISSIIVIFLESPGALAELGLFIKNRQLANKILVFVSQKHYETDSFIKLGPLRHLEGIKETSVFSYPWDEDDAKKTITPSLSEIREDIISAIDSQDKSEAFNKENEGHVSFVIYEVIRTYRALKMTEIELYLDVLGLRLKRDKLRRLIFLLRKFNLVGVSKRGHVEYYYPEVDCEKVHFGGKFDQAKAKIAAMQYYTGSENESKRVRVIQSVHEKHKHKEKQHEERSKEGQA